MAILEPLIASTSSGPMDLLLSISLSTNRSIPLLLSSLTTWLRKTEEPTELKKKKKKPLFCFLDVMWKIFC